MENINAIQIVPDEVYEIGADKAPVIPEWSVKDDETLRKKVDDLAHSVYCGDEVYTMNYDMNKFIYNSGHKPIIVDGVASDVTYANGLTAHIADSTVNEIDLTNKSWKFKFRAKFNGKPSNNCFIIDGTRSSNAYPQIQLYQNGGGGLRFLNSLTGNSGKYSDAQAYPIDNTYCDIELGYDKTTDKFTCNVYKDNELYSTGFISEGYPITMLGGFLIGSSTGNTMTIDLKYVEIEIEGELVFTGYKRGIDIIKPDDFTPNDTPSITSDGIFTTTNSTKYILKNIAYDLNKNFTLEFSCIANSTSLADADILLGTCMFKLNTSGGKLFFRGNDSSSSLANFPVANLPSNIIGKKIDIIYENKIGSGLRAGYKLSTSANYTYSSFTTGMASINDNWLYVKFNQPATETSGLVDIDLNTLKYKEEGELKWQACLRLPYTEAELNQKVVDVAYRDRVKDLFEQEGYNIYYTLGEDDFTLPSNKPNDIVKYKANGLTVAEQRADQTLTIRGACERGTDVNLPMEFFDADSYAVFGVGTTGTNTASKFTPAADGNYIAIGKGKV